MVRLGRSYPANRISKPPIIPITFDAIGAGLGATKSGTATWSQTHVIAATANCVMAGFSVWSSTTPTLVTATCGGTSMSLLSSSFNMFQVSALPASLAVFGLLNPPTGSQTVSVTLTGGGSTEDGYWESVSYRNVGGFGTAATHTATSASMSVGPVTSSSNQLIFALFCPGQTSSSTISAFSGTSRKNQAFSSGVNFTTLLGDQTGAASPTLTATNSVSDPYGAIAVPMLPIVPGQSI